MTLPIRPSLAYILSATEDRASVGAIDDETSILDSSVQGLGC